MEDILLKNGRNMNWGSLVGAHRDQRALTTPETAKMVAYNAVRVIDGAQPFHADGHVALRHGRGEITMTMQALQLADATANHVKERLLAPNGINPPYSVEDVLLMFNACQEVSQEFVQHDPSKLRVLFLLPPENGCTLYRVAQPAMALAQHLNANPEQAIIIPELSTHINIDYALYFDVVVLPRAHSEAVERMVEYFDRAGVTVIYETDDLLSNIPEWNPAKKWYPASVLSSQARVLNKSHGIIASTPELAEALGQKHKTFVCRNVIDFSEFPMKPAEPVGAGGGRTRILWAGSNTHSADLNLLQGAIKSMFWRHKNDLTWVFVGQAPECFKQNKIQDMLKAKYIEWHDGVHVTEFRAFVNSLKCHMSVAPLVDLPFNRSKSELKVLESWALGLCPVASDVAPYTRAIQSGVNGVLVQDNDAWGVRLEELLEVPGMCRQMVEAGIQRLKDEYSFAVSCKEYERAILSIVAPRMKRQACADAIKKRLQELG